MELKTMAIEFIYYSIVMIITIYIHEAGHYLTAKVFKFNVAGFRIERLMYIIPVPTAVNIAPSDKIIENVKLFEIKYLLVTINGILAGAVPLGIYLYSQDLIGLTAILGLYYIFSCSSDISKLIKLFRGEKPYEEYEMTINIPGNEEDCASMHPKCEKCGYYIVKECAGDKSIFPDKFKSGDLYRLRKIITENKIELFKN